MTDSSIYNLMAQVKDHPDYVFGTVFTSDDVEDRKEQLEQDGVEFPPSWDWKEYKDGLGNAIAYAIMNGGDWTEVIDDFLLDHATKVPW